MSGIHFCRHCGKEILPDSSFCSYCGKPLIADSQRDEVEQGATFEELSDASLTNDEDIKSHAEWEGDSIFEASSSMGDKESCANHISDNCQKRWICTVCGTICAEPTTCPACGSSNIIALGGNPDSTSYVHIYCKDQKGTDLRVWLAREGRGNFRDIWFLFDDKTTPMCSKIQSSREEIHSNTVLCYTYEGKPFLLIISDSGVYKNTYNISDSIVYGRSLEALSFGNKAVFNNAPNSLDGFYKNGAEIICVDTLKRYSYHKEMGKVIPSGLIVALCVVLGVGILVLLALLIDSNTIASIIFAVCVPAIIGLGAALEERTSYPVVTFYN